MEEWKIIENYTNYEVSNKGNIRGYKNRKIMEKIPHNIIPQEDYKGYLYVNLYNKNGMKSIKIHRLVAKAFIPNPNNLSQVNHKDEDKKNNDVSNLEWCSSIYNVNYGTGHKRSCNTRRKCCTKAIVQYDLKGNIINEFFSLSEASRVLNISLGSISDSLKGRISKVRDMFIFKYKEGI